MQAQWPPAMKSDEQLATFAGGCFWSVELAFQVGGLRGWRSGVSARMRATRLAGQGPRLTATPASPPHPACFLMCSAPLALCPPRWAMHRATLRTPLMSRRAAAAAAAASCAAFRNCCRVYYAALRARPAATIAALPDACHAITDPAHCLTSPAAGVQRAHGAHGGGTVDVPPRRGLL